MKRLKEGFIKNTARNAAGAIAGGVGGGAVGSLAGGAIGAGMGALAAGPAGALAGGAAGASLGGGIGAGAGIHGGALAAQTAGEKEEVNESGCPICKARKLAVIEGWYGLDTILFKNKKSSEVLGGKQLKEFKELKGCFLTNIFEIYKEVNHISENTYKDKSELINKVYKNAVNVLDESKNIIKDNKFKKVISEEIQNLVKNEKVSLTEAKQTSVIFNLLKTAVDKFFLESAFGNTNVNIQESEKGRILIAAHKGLRDKIIRLVL